MAQTREWALLDWAQEVVDARENRLRAAAERDAVEKATRQMRQQAEERMTERTAEGRKYEEHRCGMAPWSVRLRRYGQQVGRGWSAHAPYVWEMVRIDPPDEWLEDAESASPFNGRADEPRFCPWCGEMLDRCPDEIRGLKL
jgi:hypothetical protein